MISFLQHKLWNPTSNVSLNKTVAMLEDGRGKKESCSCYAQGNLYLLTYKTNYHSKNQDICSSFSPDPSENKISVWNLRVLLRDRAAVEFPFSGMLKSVESFALNCYEIPLNSFPSLPLLGLGVRMEECLSYASILSLPVWSMEVLCSWGMNLVRLPSCEDTDNIPHYSLILPTAKTSEKQEFL